MYDQFRKQCSLKLNASYFKLASGKSFQRRLDPLQPNKEQTEKRRVAYRKQINSTGIVVPISETRFKYTSLFLQCVRQTKQYCMSQSLMSITALGHSDNPHRCNDTTKVPFRTGISIPRSHPCVASHTCTLHPNQNYFMQTQIMSQMFN